MQMSALPFVSQKAQINGSFLEIVFVHATKSGPWGGKGVQGARGGGEVTPLLRWLPLGL